MEKKIKLDKTVLAMLNPIFYIKPSSGVDVYALFEKLSLTSFEDFFEMPKNSLIIAGELSEEDERRINTLYKDLLFPKLVIFLGEKDISSTPSYANQFYLNPNFSSTDYQDLLEEILRGENA